MHVSFFPTNFLRRSWTTILETLLHDVDFLGYIWKQRYADLFNVPHFPKIFGQYIAALRYVSRLREVITYKLESTRWSSSK